MYATVGFCGWVALVTLRLRLGREIFNGSLLSLPILSLLLNQGEYGENGKITIKIDPSTEFFQPTESYLSFRLKLKLGSVGNGMRLQTTHKRRGRL